MLLSHNKSAILLVSCHNHCFDLVRKCYFVKRYFDYRRLANNSLDLQDQHIEGYLEDLFSCVYALNTLGYTIIARSLAAQLAEALLAQFNFDHNHLSVAIKSAYICKVMKEASECHQIAFKLGVLGLAMPREPASTKLHEVDV